MTRGKDCQLVMDISERSDGVSEGAISAWQLLGTWGVFEYWLAPDGDKVYRRRESADNYLDNVSGAPMNARYETSLASFERFVAGCLPV